MISKLLSGKSWPLSQHSKIERIVLWKNNTPNNVINSTTNNLLIQDTPDSKDFDLSQYINLDRINPNRLPPRKWAESIGFIFDQKKDDSFTITGLNTSISAQAIKKMFHDIVMASDTDFALYNISGYYEIRSALKNKDGNITVARIIYRILNYHPGLRLWSSFREQDLLTALMRELKTTVHNMEFRRISYPRKRCFSDG